MKEFEIWSEGFLCTGMEGVPARASLLGKEMAINWEQAVEQYMAKNPKRIDVREYNGEKVYTDWGCRLFDNEADARKSFG